MKDEFHRNVAAIVEHLESAGVGVQESETHTTGEENTVTLEVFVPQYRPNELRRDDEEDEDA